jgi:hypothetical protein
MNGFQLLEQIELKMVEKKVMIVVFSLGYQEHQSQQSQ